MEFELIFRGKVAGFFWPACTKMAEDGDERTIELTIEALTGTVYDLCVSPYETILGIKLKVQRLEGENWHQVLVITNVVVAN